MNTKEQRDRLVARRADMKHLLNMEMRNRMVPTSAAVRINKEIQAIQKQIDAIDREAAERLRINSAPIDEVLQIVAIPLLADCMNDLVAGVDGMLRKMGCQETIFSEYTAQIRRASLAMVDTLENTKAGLPRLLEVDDTLVDAVNKKLMSFIRQRLKIKKS